MTPFAFIVGPEGVCRGASSSLSLSTTARLARRGGLDEGAIGSSLSESSIVIVCWRLVDRFGRELVRIGEEPLPFMKDLVDLDVGDEMVSRGRESSIDARGVGSDSATVRRFFLGLGDSSIRINAERSLTASGWLDFAGEEADSGVNASCVCLFRLALVFAMLLGLDADLGATLTVIQQANCFREQCLRSR